MAYESPLVPSPEPASPYDVTCAASPDGKGTVITRVSTPPGSERKKREHRPVPRQADAMSASRAKVDPVRLHLDSALQALDDERVFFTNYVTNGAVLSVCR